MLAGGVPLLSVGVLGFLCVCAYAAVKVPEWSAMEILSLNSWKWVELGAQFFCIQKKAKFHDFFLFKFFHFFVSKTNG